VRCQTATELFTSRDENSQVFGILEIAQDSGLFDAQSFGSSSADERLAVRETPGPVSLLSDSNTSLRIPHPALLPFGMGNAIGCIVRNF